MFCQMSTPFFIFLRFSRFFFLFLLYIQDKAAHPAQANPLYELFNKELRSYGLQVPTGVFGADMKVELLNDGPVTIILDSAEL